jgi:hypothetical protein
MDEEENIISYLKYHALTEEAVCHNKTIYEKKKVKKWHDITPTNTSRVDTDNEVLNERQKIVTKIFPSLQTVRIKITNCPENFPTEEDIEDKQKNKIHRTSIKHVLAYMKDQPKIPKSSVMKEEKIVKENNIINKLRVESKLEEKPDITRKLLKENIRSLNRSQTMKSLDSMNKDKNWFNNKENLEKEFLPDQFIKFSGSSANFRNKKSNKKFEDVNLNKLNVPSLNIFPPHESKSKSVSKDGYGCRHTIHQIYQSYNNKISDYILKNRNSLRLYGSMKYSDKNPIFFLKERHGKSAEEILNNENILNEVRGGIVDLTPLPSKSRKRMKSQNEKKEFFEGERSAVAMRRYEYTFKNKRGVIRIDNNFIESTCLVQRWWKTLRGNKKTSAAIFIQKVFRGHFVRQKLKRIFYWIIKFSKLELIQRNFINKIYSFFWKILKNKNDLSGKNYVKPKLRICYHITKNYIPIFVIRKIKKLQQIFRRYIINRLYIVSHRNIINPFTFLKTSKSSDNLNMIVKIQKRIRKYLKHIRLFKNIITNREFNTNYMKFSYYFIRMKKLIKIQSTVKKFLKEKKNLFKPNLKSVIVYPVIFKKVIKGFPSRMILKIHRLANNLRIPKCWRKFLSSKNKIDKPAIYNVYYSTKNFRFVPSNNYVKKIQSVWKNYKEGLNELKLPKIKIYESTKYIQDNNYANKGIIKIQKAYKEYQKNKYFHNKVSIIPLIENKIVLFSPLSKILKLQRKLKSLFSLKIYSNKICKISNICSYTKNYNFNFKKYLNISAFKIYRVIKNFSSNSIKHFINKSVENKHIIRNILIKKGMLSNIIIKKVVLIQNFLKNFFSNKKIMNRKNIIILNGIYYTKSYFSENFNKNASLIIRKYKMSFKNSYNNLNISTPNIIKGCSNIINKKSLVVNCFRKIIIAKNIFNRIAIKIQNKYRKFLIIKKSEFISRFTRPIIHPYNTSKKYNFSISMSTITKIQKLFIKLLGTRNRFIIKPFTVTLDRFFFNEQNSLNTIQNSIRILFFQEEVQHSDELNINKREIGYQNFFSKKIKNNHAQTRIKKIQKNLRKKMAFKKYLDMTTVFLHPIYNSGISFTKLNKNIFFRSNGKRILKLLLRNYKEQKFKIINNLPKIFEYSYTKKICFNAIKFLKLQICLRKYLSKIRKIYNRKQISPIMIDNLTFRGNLKIVSNIQNFIRKGLFKHKINKIDYLLRDIQLNFDRKKMKDALKLFKKIEPKTIFPEENLFTNFNVLTKINSRHAEKFKNKIKKYANANKREAILKSIFIKKLFRDKEELFKIWKNYRIETILNISANSFNEKYSSALDIDEEEQQKSLKIRLKLTQKFDEEDEDLDIMNVIGKKHTNMNKFNSYFQKINEKKENESENNLSKSFLSISHQNEDDSLLHVMKISKHPIYKQKVDHLNVRIKKPNKSTRTIIRDNNEIDILKYGTSRTKRDFDFQNNN